MAEPIVPMIDAEAVETEHPRKGPLERIAFAVGAAGLLMAMATDALAVAGRHSGVTVLGSIEIVQACVVFVATAAMIGATIHGAHARVHIILEHVGSRTGEWLERGADLISAALFLWLAAGSAWLAHDLWQGIEITELLGLPLRWLRMVWILGALIIAGLFAAHALRRRRVAR